MKHFKLSIAIIFSACVLFLCSCNNSAGAANSAETKNSSTPTPSSNPVNSGDNGTITCKIDGVSKTFQLSQSFIDIPLDIERTGPKNGIMIADGGSKKEGFQFEFKNSGTTKIKKDGMGDTGCTINYYNPQGVTYTGSDVTISVTSYNSQHVTGTFSGKLVNAYYDLGTKGAQNYPRFIQITDGKFDVHN